MGPLVDDILGNGFYEELQREGSAGCVSVRTHRDDPTLEVWNYTQQAVIEGRWNRATRAARGLILNTSNGEIPTLEALPLEKFFNHSESHAPEIGLLEQVDVVDKYDGSLGIAYLAPDGRPAIATRGSFHSEQAEHATAWLRERPEHEAWVLSHVEGDFTPLFEIIYPQNRIVVDYDEVDELVLLGDRDRLDRRRYLLPEWWEDSIEHWPGMRAQRIGEGTMSLFEALSLEPRPNAEGVVVSTADGRRVKIKQEDYVALHRIVTGLNERAVWEAGPKGLNGLLVGLPDELHAWTLEVHDSLLTEAAHRVAIARAHCSRLRRHWVPRERWYAELIANGDDPSLVFAVADGRDALALAWKQLKPKGETQKAQTNASV